MSDVPARPSAAKFTRVQVRRIGRQRDNAVDDLAAVEEPLEVRLHGRPFAVIMRTPGDDRALAAGFLLSEGVVAGLDDLGAVEHCRHPDHPETHNIVDVYLHGHAAANLESLLHERRNVLTNSSCGLCGRVTIESLQLRVPPIVSTWRITREIVAALPDRLRERQVTFAETGGLHAAGLFQPDGTCDLIAEDVGRHNAVDKVVGAMLMENRVPLYSARARGQRPDVLRDRAEGLGRRHRAGLRRLSPVEPGHRARERSGDHAARIRPRRGFQRVYASRAHRVAPDDSRLYAQSHHVFSSSGQLPDRPT